MYDALLAKLDPASMMEDHELESARVVEGASRDLQMVGCVSQGAS